MLVLKKPRFDWLQHVYLLRSPDKKGPLILTTTTRVELNMLLWDTIKATPGQDRGRGVLIDDPQMLPNISWDNRVVSLLCDGS